MRLHVRRTPRTSPRNRLLGTHRCEQVQSIPGAPVLIFRHTLSRDMPSAKPSRPQSQPRQLNQGRRIVKPRGRMVAHLDDGPSADERRCDVLMRLENVGSERPRAWAARAVSRTRRNVRAAHRTGPGAAVGALAISFN